jgi:DNA-binding response OmpR family regulator
MRVLVAEDDLLMLAGIADILEGEGYEVITARDGQEAITLFRERAPDFICLDIMMPYINGYDACRLIRRESTTVPVIFLSAKSEEIDKVIGLELGADDYIMKPFGMKEFVARMRAVSRRCYAARPETERPGSFRMGEVEVLVGELRARRGDGPLIELSLREVKLLEVLYQNRGQVLSRDHLFNACWGGDRYPNTRTLDQHISQLRKKIERDPKSPAIIETVRGAGYRYDG